ncbi:MAG: TolB family protein, partial [Kofleriaceae bacterium]
IVYVERTGAAAAGRLEFDTFQGGADLMVAQTTFGVDQRIEPAGGGTSLLAGCAGVGISAGGDIQSPNVAHDGRRIVFAGRNSASEPLGVFMVDIDGSNCQRVTPAAADSNGLKVHNFDPVWSPDGASIVFASTRGKSGATRSRKRFLPQSDLWRVRVNGATVDQSSYEQMTFLSNSEVGPAFMREGRVTMTTEKASDGFYQLSGRRMNWDLTDYHPLLAQRKDSMHADPSDLASTLPSIGYSSATDIREASTGDFLLILSDLQANGAPAVPGAAGALAVFNRSVGPFEADRATEGFLRSMRIVGSPAATGRMGATAGYRRPVSLPDGTIMVSYTSNPGSGRFDIVAVNPRDNTQRELFTSSANRVDAVLAYKSPPRQLYYNRRQLVFGGAADLGDNGHAVIHMPDAPMTFTMLLANLRRGRPVDAFRRARYLAVYTEGLCPSGPCSANTNGIYENRSLLGRAELASDGSVKVRLPSQTGVVLELQDGSGNSIARMGEEHQLGPAERISMGVRAELFDSVCGGCHGSISGRELDVSVTPDALTGASQSRSAGQSPTTIGP